MLIATIATAVIALLALILSIYNWYYDFVHNKANINLIFKSCKHLGNVYGKPLSFYLTIENLSHLDVSISRMFLHIGDVSFEFDTLPNYVMEYSSPYDVNHIFSKELPLKITGLGAVGGFFNVNTKDFPLLEASQLFEKDVSITVHTNRKLVKTFKIDINKANTHL